MGNANGSSSSAKRVHGKTLEQRWRLEQRRRAELDLLYRLSARLAGSSRIEVMAAAIAGSTLEAVGGTFSALVLHEGEKGVCWALATRWGRGGAHPLRVGQRVPEDLWPLFRQALGRREPWVVSRPLDDRPSLSADEDRLLKALGVQSLCLVPVRVKEEPLGVLVLGERRRPDRSAYDAEKQRLLMTIAQLAANALRRARLHRELAQAYGDSRRRAERMERLVQIGLTLNRTLTLDEVGEAVGQAAMELSGADRVAVYLRRADLPLPYPLWSRGFPREYFTLLRRYADERPDHCPSTQPEVLVFDDVLAQQAFPVYQELGRAGGFRGLGIFPLVWEGQAVGTVNVHFAKPHDWTEDEVETLMIFASQAAEALENARLYQALEEAYLEAALALAKAMDARDAYTGDHSERLAHWAEAVARELGCTKEDIEALRWAARLHDIGKIGVPDAILYKSGPLTEEEWAVMKRHPVIGAEIVAQVRKLAPAAEIVRHHHERYDGTGYPDGLKGDEIPLGARILAVVDAYGAILDRRPYKEARSHEQAVAELRRGAGTQFDPVVVEAFLRVLARESRAGSDGGDHSPPLASSHKRGLGPSNGRNEARKRWDQKNKA